MTCSACKTGHLAPPDRYAPKGKTKTTWIRLCVDCGCENIMSKEEIEEQLDLVGKNRLRKNARTRRRDIYNGSVSTQYDNLIYGGW